MDTECGEPAEGPLLARVGQVAGDTPGLRALVLHGSRARNQAAPHSDWDFGYLADDNTDVAMLHTRITEILGTDAVDLVDLSTASALLRFRAARDGVALFELEPGSFLEFRETATRFWCDVEPVLRKAYADVLAAL